MNETVYARFEYDHRRNKLCFEPLDSHLARVGVLSACLAARVDPGDDEANVAAAIAGLLHDIGKIIYNVIEGPRIEKLKAQFFGGGQSLLASSYRLSFAYHELLSSALLAYVAHANLDSLENSGISEHVVRSAVRAIIMHHQGLRGVSVDNLLRGLSIINNVINRIVGRGLLEYLANSLGHTVREAYYEFDNIIGKVRSSCNVNPDKVKPILDMLNAFYSGDSGNILAAINYAGPPYSLLELWARIGEEDRLHVIERARMITGFLMTADNVVARRASLPCEASASLYVEETENLARSLLGDRLVDLVSVPHVK